MVWSEAVNKLIGYDNEVGRVGIDKCLVLSKNCLISAVCLFEENIKNSTHNMRKALFMLKRQLNDVRLFKEVFDTYGTKNLYIKQAVDATLSSDIDAVEKLYDRLMNIYLSACAAEI